MVLDFLKALTLGRFAIFPRPESSVYLPGHEGAAFRGGFGCVFRSIACPTRDTDCIHHRLGDSCVYSEVLETPVPPDSRVIRNVVRRGEEENFKAPPRNESANLWLGRESDHD
jgi:hypothetical protein